ncbi:DUF2948 domain-containing protein [Phyllobacterium phragmitis]|uniref:DUF2948 domain-containing protein n=1 Tax=Phyllobacterium phragmitis TaxID=2670329 RepID=A0A2S9IK05_9HYPH|nr:DUF2948 family protein [Phyllobacterium phragmitis]PRD40832.1 DUF2948 domain-containing protein [Phyllobacterium phragmitis]
MEMLKLVALDDGDLQIISAHLQDAVLKVSDLDYLPREKRFVVAANRFVWERAETGGFGKRTLERRRSVLHFDCVTAVKASGIDRSRKDDVLSLLAVRFLPGDAPAGVVEFTFSGNAAIRLDVECIEAKLTDLGPAWEARSKPEHDA